MHMVADLNSKHSIDYLCKQLIQVFMAHLNSLCYLDVLMSVVTLTYDDNRPWYNPTLGICINSVKQVEHKTIDNK